MGAEQKQNYVNAAYVHQASMSTKRMTPTIAISYDYEYGD